MIQTGVLDRIVVSPINYYASFVSNAAVIVFFLFYGLTHSSSDIAVCVAAGLTGLVFWSLVEYAMHRFVFHGFRTAAKRIHLRHHQQPYALVGSPIFIVLAILFTLWFVLRSVLADDIASFFEAGLVIGYLYFTVLHHMLHRDDRLVRALSRSRLYHDTHHRAPKVNFGFTTMFWDRVFGTFDAGDSP